MRQLKQLIKGIVPRSIVRSFDEWGKLPAAAKLESARDRRRELSPDPGPLALVHTSLDWLCVAQDRSSIVDGGVARHFSLVSGWSRSYPETTGYIVPTFLTAHALAHRADAAQRARKMLDWLVSIQMDGGGFQGGMIGATPLVPVTFNTGQILLGLAAGYSHFQEQRYLDATVRAATWLRDTQDSDGCWRRHPTPFAAAGEKTYETHVAWGMFEADRVAPGQGFGDAGHRQVAWALTKQTGNGWLRDCCLNDPVRPLTHTLGYALRGLLEAYRHQKHEPVLLAAVKLAKPMADLCLRNRGFLPGRLDSTWTAAVRWNCLTGAVQNAACWLELFALTGERVFLEAGRQANAFVRRTVSIDGADSNVRGAVKGSYPVAGDYGRFEYLNWAAKFAIDSNIRELAA